MSEYKEENGLIINTDGVDSFCLSSARELSITRDVAERLVFAQMSEITYENVCEYYARLDVLDFAYRTSLLTGTMFDEEGNQLEDRQLKVIDFISRIGITTNLKKNTLRNFLDSAVARLDELHQREIISYTYSYEYLLERFYDAQKYFLLICDTNALGRVNETMHAPGLIRAIELCATGAAYEDGYNGYLAEIKADITNRLGGME